MDSEIHPVELKNHEKKKKQENSDSVVKKGFPGGSAGKESAHNVGDLGSIPGLGRSPGERSRYPLQYSWASLVAQLLKNPPALWETLVQSLGWEDPLENRKTTHSNILAWRIPWTVHEITKS